MLPLPLPLLVLLVAILPGVAVAVAVLWATLVLELVLMEGGVLQQVVRTHRQQVLVLQIPVRLIVAGVEEVK